jgi:hypothetical protein
MEPHLRKMLTGDSSALKNLIELFLQIFLTHRDVAFVRGFIRVFCCWLSTPTFVVKRRAGYIAGHADHVVRVG